MLVVRANNFQPYPALHRLLYVNYGFSRIDKVYTVLPATLTYSQVIHVLATEHSLFLGRF